MNIERSNTKGRKSHILIFKTSIRILLAAVFFIVGFNFSNTLFFHEHPLFGVPLLAEIVISLAAGLFGFQIFPIVLIKIKNWLEEVVAKTVSNIVSDFWEQQSKRMQDARRQKQKEKKLEIEKKNKEKMEDGIILDTSVVIDGRVLDIVKIGFLDETLIIPQAVINELHLISDNEDGLKRQRGRRGLDIVKELKKIAKVVIFKDSDGNSKEGVDKGLIKSAKKNNTKLMTLDFNLNKVAAIEGIKVLNINDLANVVKLSLLPGERLKIKIIQEGKEKRQGVGYLPDGTMIVVDEAKDRVGEEVDVKVSKVIQTPAGKMVFCSIVG